MAGIGNFQAAASIDLVDVFAGKVAAANSAPRHVWDKNFEPQGATFDHNSGVG